MTAPPRPAATGETAAGSAAESAAEGSAAETAEGSAAGSDASDRSGRLRRPHRRVVLVALGAVMTLAVAWWGRSWVAGAAGTVARASPGWLVVAVLAKGVSMAGLALGQRRLVGRGAQRRPGLRSVLATAYAGNTISTTFPLAGAGLSAAFTYRRYVAGGAPAPQVATGLAVSWAVATSALTAVLSAAAAATGQTGLLVTGLLGGLASMAVVVGLLVAVRSGRGQSWGSAVGTRTVRLVQRVAHRPAGDPGQLVGRALRQLGETRLRSRDVSAAAGHGLVLWTADVACLGAALLAIGARLPLPLLVLAWSAGVAATSFSLTPGGLGLVEAALTAALVAAGLPATAALAGVLLYRVIGFWLTGAVGALVLVSTRGGGAVRPAQDGT